MINVGIIGCGFVGGALKDWLEHNNPECKLFISDPAKGYNDDLSNIDVAFLQIHVPTEDDGTQDLSLMKELIKKLPDVPVFFRTTILPGTSALLTRETGHKVYYMPEFLSERTYIEDFQKQTKAFTGEQALLTKIFVGKKFTVMTPSRPSSPSTCTTSSAPTRSPISTPAANTASRWEPTGAMCTRVCCFRVISTTPTPTSLVPTASTATVASASPRMSMPLPR